MFYTIRIFSIFILSLFIVLWSEISGAAGSDDDNLQGKFLLAEGLSPKQASLISAEQINELNTRSGESPRTLYTETLSYFCNTTWCFYSGNPLESDSFNMRFTPGGPCQLYRIIMHFYEIYSVDSTGEGIDVVVWDDDGSGFPGNEIYRINVLPDDLYADDTLVLDVSDENLTFDNDFHIGFAVIDIPAGNRHCILADDGSCGNNRGSFYCDTAGNWMPMSDFGSLDNNLAIVAVIKYNNFVTMPSRNELNVPVGTNIEITFPVDMNAGSIEDTSFIVNSEFRGRVEGAISYDIPTRTATFNPNHDFAPG